MACCVADISGAGGVSAWTLLGPAAAIVARTTSRLAAGRNAGIAAPQSATVGPSEAQRHAPLSCRSGAHRILNAQGMRYDFTAEQLAWRNEVRAFCEANVTEELRAELRQAGNEGDGPLAKAFH